jgi:hypothetical protein
MMLFAGLASADQSLTILIDDWWNVDYAKNACFPAHQGTEKSACESLNVAAMRDFERKLVTQFAAAPVCRGVTIVSWGTKEMSDAVNRPHWQLMLDVFDAGEHPQAWTIVNGAALFEGKGNPQKTATDICNLVKQNGAKAT